jgi:hypothetical protein
MRNQTILPALLLVAGLTTALVPVSATAAGLDGKASLICAAIDVVGCTNGPGCMEGRASAFQLPQFMVVDFENKLIRATDESGHKEVSPIRNSEQTEKQIILQGVENHRGWSVAIDRQSGEMTISSVGAEVGFMIFGACTAL